MSKTSWNLTAVFRLLHIRLFCFLFPSNNPGACHAAWSFLPAGYFPDSQYMEQAGAFQFLQPSEGIDQLYHIVTVHGPKITDAQRLE